MTTSNWLSRAPVVAAALALGLVLSLASVTTSQAKAYDSPISESWHGHGDRHGGGHGGWGCGR